MESDLLTENMAALMQHSNNEDEDFGDLRVQEIEILKSIYDESLIQDNRQSNFYRIKINVNVPEGFVLKTATSTGGAEAEVEAAEAETTDEELSNNSDSTTTTTTNNNNSSSSSNNAASQAQEYPIVCLPTVTLGFELPRGYPEVSPILVISCCWLSLDQMNSIIKELNSMWESGEMVIFKYVDWIKNNLFTFLDIEKSLTLTDVDVDFDSPLADYCIWEYNEDWTSLMSALPIILAHNSHESKKIFNETVHTCPICLCDDEGVNFDLLACSHFTCHGCTTQICKLNIDSGDIRQIKCSELKCGQPIDQNIVEKCVSAKDFATYKSTIQKTNGFVECTRCRGWAKVEPHTRSTFCEKCYYSMCMLCSKKWHPGTTCGYEPISRVKTFVKYGETIQYNRNYKPCPGCGVTINKYEGCNKVVCTSCNKIICWICLNVIDGYDHFQKKCLLFELPSGMQDMLPLIRVNRIHTRVTGRSTCNRCKAQIYRHDNNNHLICFQCKSQQCFICKSLIKGTNHFSNGTCPQHYGEPLKDPNIPK